MRSQHQNVKENEILVVLRFEYCKYNAAARCFKLRKVIFPQFCYACSLFSSAFELRLVTFLSHLPEAQKGNYVVELPFVLAGLLCLLQFSETHKSGMRRIESGVCFAECETHIVACHVAAVGMRESACVLVGMRKSE